MLVLVQLLTVESGLSFFEDWDSKIDHVAVFRESQANRKKRKIYHAKNNNAQKKNRKIVRVKIQSQIYKHERIDLLFEVKACQKTRELL
jgi:hypothetical protein